jgi:glycerophosphoryl diester phosphodiesterase
MGDDDSTLSRRKLLSAVGASVAALATIPVVYQGSVRRPPLVVGHRGVAGLEAPNTIAGIRLAADLGADGVALDVRRTADGELILFHDPILDVSTNGSGRVDEMTADEIAEIRVEGEPIPTLREALSVLDGLELLAFFELKEPGYAAETLAAVRAFGLEHRTVLTSFRPAALTEIDSRSIERGLLGSVPHPGLFEEAVATDCGIVLSHYVPYGLEWFVEEATTRGLRSGIWELASTEAHIEDALSFDIDVLATNRPDIALEMTGR